MARLDLLCAEDNKDHARHDENEHERREKLFEWVIRINYYTQLC